MTLLTLVGCGSKENAVSLEVTSSFALSAAGYSGGLVVSGKNAIGQRFVKTVFGGTSLKVVLPDGAWDLSVVGWDGVSPFNGDAYCGKSSINLSGTDASATVTINEANCLNSDFSGSPFVNTGISKIYPLKIVTCGAFYKHISDSSFTKLTEVNSTSATSDFCSFSVHPVDLRSRTKSIKLIPIDKNFNGAYGGQPSNNPVCVTGSEGVFNLPQQIPVAGLPVQIAFYEDSACKKQSSFVLFPDGLKQGYAAKFDSIVDHKTADAIMPSVANRLIVSDNGINRGWSPFYAQMPFFKCSTGFCGDFVAGFSSAKYADAIHDYFMEVDYQGTVNEPQPLVFPASSNICSAVIANHPSTVPGYTNYLDTPSCTYSVVDGKGQITVMVKPKVSQSPCLSELNDICRSPAQKFILIVNGEEKEIYFSGKKDYGGSVQPVPFSHLFVPVRQATNISTCLAYDINNVSNAGTNVLQPVLDCVDPAATLPLILAKAFYNSGNKSFQVEDSGTNWGEITFDDASAAMTKNLLMLPPDAQEQRNLTNLIFETIGGTGWPESFKYENNNDSDGDEYRAYGSIRRAREIFSPDGPGGLFGDANTDVCSTTVGTKQIRLTHKAQPHDIEITITNINGNTSVDSRHLRPTAYCNDTNLTPGSCGVAAPQNYGKFEKAMLIKEDGVAKEVVLFDCGSKIGRYEAVHSDMWGGKYQRGKELMYWNTQNSAYARFERYSRQMESSVSNFASTTRSERSFEKVFKYTGAQDKVHGRFYKYSTYIVPETSAVSQNMTAARFQLYKPSGSWDYSYAFFDFHEPSTNDLFPSTGEYSTLKTDAFTHTHFCGTGFKFPQDFLYNKDCSTSNFISSEVAPLFGTFTSYQHIKGTNFDPIMNSGYFPVSWP
jgi:hypothetical protein